MRPHETLIRRLYEDVLNGGDLESATQILATGAIDHAPPASSSLPIGTHDGLLDFLTELCDAFPDVQWAVEQVREVGSAVVVETCVHGSHHGAFRGMRAMGRQFTIRSTDVVRIDHGKIVEHWGELDLVSLRRQLETHAAAQDLSAQQVPPF